MDGLASQLLLPRRNVLVAERQLRGRVVLRLLQGL